RLYPLSLHDALPIFSFASFPQYRHVSATSSCSNGIHLDVTCVSSFIFSSQAWSPHHIAFIKPGFSSNAVVNSSILVTVVILFARDRKSTRLNSSHVS